MDDNKPVQPSAEQLLKLLDMQLDASRARRQASEAARKKFRVLAIAMIIVGAALALWIGLYVLEEMRASRGIAPAGLGAE